jgi:ATP-dependent DNA ligase
LSKPLSQFKAARFVLDGEIAIPQGAGLSFDALLQRIHPSATRINKLARETPAILIVFDLLVTETGDDLSQSPIEIRRAALERFAKKFFPNNDRIVLSPATRDVKSARRWFAGVGTASATLDGVIAKRLHIPYQSGNRDGMVKIKKLRTADCVVGGFRYATNSKQVGSLLLGLYDADGLLHHVGFCSSFSAAERKTLLPLLKPHMTSSSHTPPARSPSLPPGFTGRAPGGPSRWSTERSTQWQPLAPNLVVEVRYDHFTNGRFRHGAKFLRWRPDKAPRKCLISQVETESKATHFPLRHAG